MRSVDERFAAVEAAFRADGFVVRDRRVRGEDIGVLAEHGTARSTVTGAPKRAYYVEGDGTAMGWLIGRLAEPDVTRMCTEFAREVVFAFFGAGNDKVPEERAGLKDLLVRIIGEAAEKMLPDIPPRIVEEIDGMVEGCREENPRTEVTRDRLLALNLGVDCLLAHVYTGKLFAERGVHPGRLRTPIGCNAFALTGAAAGGRTLFGRDFMFPTAGVFQDTACIVIAAPRGAAHRRDAASHVVARQGAPGLVGAITAMNDAGLAVGVDMLPSTLCDPARPGLDSLLLVRGCAEAAGTVRDAARHVTAAPRGVSWLYPMADATGDACVVEGGRALPPHRPFPPLDGIPRWYRRRLPGRSTLARVRRAAGLPEPDRGVVVRGLRWSYPSRPLHRWNRTLWSAFDSDWRRKLRDIVGGAIGALVDLVAGKTGNLWTRFESEIRDILDGTDFATADFTERGFLDSTWKERKCPGPFYFPPQREQRPDVIVATNHALSPEVRLTAMTGWIALLSGGAQDDMQWRYDVMNRRILDALDVHPQGIDRDTAWSIIDFLNPAGDFPDYYNAARGDWRRVEVHGSVTLCDLGERSMTCRFGYYGDDAVTIRLTRYVITKE